MRVFDDGGRLKNRVTQVKDEKTEHERNGIAPVHKHIADHDTGINKQFYDDGQEECVDKFDESLSGSRVRVFGVVREDRIDAKYLNEWEAEVKKPDPNHAVGVHSGAVGHEDQDTKDKLDNINSLREDLKKCGKDHLSFFTIEADKFTELK